MFYGLGSLRLFRKLLKSYRGKVAILMYHRVVAGNKEINDNTGTCISEKQFEDHIKYLSSNYSIISIDDIFQYQADKEGKLPVVITFDDGYKDNLQAALPVLKKYNAPAVIYITTRFPEGDCRTWWYELSEIIQNRNTIEYYFDNQKKQFNVQTPKLKAMVSKLLIKWIYTLSPDHQKEVMNSIRGNSPIKDYKKLCLSWKEIRILDKEPLITIGAHTHSHYNLKTLEKEDVHKEIYQSKILLEKKLNHSIDHFAYPFGNRQASGEREYNIVKELLFKTAVTTLCFPLNSVEHYTALPRHSVTPVHNIKYLNVKLSGWNAFWKKQV